MSLHSSDPFCLFLQLAFLGTIERHQNEQIFSVSCSLWYMIMSLMILFVSKLQGVSGVNVSCHTTPISIFTHSCITHTHTHCLSIYLSVCLFTHLPIYLSILEKVFIFALIYKILLAVICESVRTFLHILDMCVYACMHRNTRTR